MKYSNESTGFTRTLKFHRGIPIFEFEFHEETDIDVSGDFVLTAGGNTPTESILTHGSGATLDEHDSIIESYSGFFRATTDSVKPDRIIKTLRFSANSGYICFRYAPVIHQPFRSITLLSDTDSIPSSGSIFASSIQGVRLHTAH